MSTNSVISFIVSILGTILTAIATWITIDQNVVPIESRNLVIILVYLIAGLVFLIAYIWIRRNAYKRYYDAYPYLNSAFSKCHLITNVHIPDNQRLEEDTETMTRFCNMIKKAFETITTRDCSVCIKLLGKENGLPTIETFVRDTASAEFRPSKDQDKKQGIVHLLSENTAFKEIVGSGSYQEFRGNSYYCNFLPLENFYQNSRFKGTGYPPKGRFLQYFYRLKKWPLPYKSTIVVPIVLEGKENLEGFLCIDSKNMGSFGRKKQVEVLQSVASGMTNAMDNIKTRHLL